MCLLSPRWSFREVQSFRFQNIDSIIINLQGKKIYSKLWNFILLFCYWRFCKIYLIYLSMNFLWNSLRSESLMNVFSFFSGSALKKKYGWSKIIHEFILIETFPSWFWLQKFIFLCWTVYLEQFLKTTSSSHRLLTFMSLLSAAEEGA